MGYAFISYNTKDQILANTMRDFLKKQRVNVWMAPGDIPAGRKYAEVINNAIKECSCVILLLSQASQNSVWVAKEVERAVSYRKPIIPVQFENVVLTDEFELYISTDQIVPLQKIDEDSEQIQKLLISVSGYTGMEKKETTLKTNRREEVQEIPAVEKVDKIECVNTLEYFAKNVVHMSELEIVDMAFHAGAEWHRSTIHNDLLYDLAENGIKINILLNDVDAADVIAKHMRHKRTDYMSFEEARDRWKSFEKEYPDLVEVRIVSIPILRCYHSCHMKNEEKDTVHVKYYTYANANTNNNLQQSFSRETDCFKLYRDEFEYLWDKGKI